MAKVSPPRPRRPRTRKTRFLQVRIDDAESSAFHRAAEIAGLDLSAWVRTRLREVSRAELEEFGVDIPFLPKKKPAKGSSHRRS